MRQTEAIPYLIGIGRNIQDKPMKDKKWNEFRANLAMAIDAAIPKQGPNRFARQLFAGSGLGQWAGKVEQSVQVIVVLTKPEAKRLRSGLADLAYLFKQQAIAMSPLDRTDFVKPLK